MVYHIPPNRCNFNLIINSLGRRQLTIHLLGPEREADLVHIYSYLLPLIPNTDLILHMIGPNVSKRLQPSHQSYFFTNRDQKQSTTSADSDDNKENMNQDKYSTIFISLRSEEYGPAHNDGSVYFGLESSKRGKSPPDLVVIHNAGVFQYPSWFPTLQLLAQKGQPTLLTEPIETGVEVMEKNFVAAVKLKREDVRMKETGDDVEVNPFRGPIFQWKKEVNLPGWSNAFVTGFGKFEN